MGYKARAPHPVEWTDDISLRHRPMHVAEKAMAIRPCLDSRWSQMQLQRYWVAVPQPQIFVLTKLAIAIVIVGRIFR